MTPAEHGRMMGKLKDSDGKDDYVELLPAGVDQQLEHSCDEKRSDGLSDKN